MLLLAVLPAGARQFFNLTAQEVKIDSLLPVFHQAIPLGRHYADSTYQVSITYPEFIKMDTTDIARYKKLSGKPLGSMPEVSQSITVARKEGTLHVSFIPLVYRDGSYQKLVSFMLKVNATANNTPKRRATAASQRYASNSVLREGSWAKISVPATGIYQLTTDLIRRAGFTDVSKVKVYGYGGALQPEQLTGSYLEQTDDLQEVPVCEVGGKRLFYAIGPVSWNSSNKRIRNPYANYGCYFITQNDDEPKTISSEDFQANNYPRHDDYNRLYEVDDYAWYQGGRNLYDAKELKNETQNTYTLLASGATASGRLTVSLSGRASSSGALVEVFLNDESVGTLSYEVCGEYDAMRTAERTFTVALKDTNTVALVPNASAGTVRLDYLSCYSPQAAAFPDLNGSFPVPDYVYNISNQNHHAAQAADMVIIIPTTQKLLGQAQRLKTLHEELDGLRVNIVPADELYNEFSSGTPDANAYRRYLKMLYDRAENDADMPRYLLLLGDCVWDNRLQTSATKVLSADDLLLCYESENSYSHTHCYITDDYFCLMDDGEGSDIVSRDAPDIAVGRITAQTADDAAIVVDKIVSYTTNQEAGAWQNVMCFMGDDGNDNSHMTDANIVATQVEQSHPALQVKRVMWDAYNRVTSSTGNSYPDVTRIIKQQMQDGALVMNYSGHGRADAISHEYVLRLADFGEATSLRLPLWLTASCDIMPFDGMDENIGETAMFNKKGGAVAFYGTTRTVYQNYNRVMNLAFMRYLLSKDNAGKTMTFGEAVRLAKTELVTGKDTQGTAASKDQTTNRLQYSLLGDPAVRLALPTKKMEVLTINDTDVSNGASQVIKAGSTAKVTGRVLTDDGQTDTAFNGVASALIRDVKEQVVCLMNDPTTSKAFTYYDRINTIYSGNNNVKEGLFDFTFAVPKDIKYSDLDALINLYAVNNDKSAMANGYSDKLVLNGTDESASDTKGPSIYCYLNSTSFVNGGDVNPTPYFVAELNDEDGINASGGSIGHDLQLIIDGEVAKTYSLNNYFQFDFGSYTTGKVGYSIPTLSYGTHKLLFRAWDVLNNSSTAELTFNVVKGVTPLFLDVDCTPNPAHNSTTFRITHDRASSAVDIRIDIFDTSGRHLWTYDEKGVSTGNTYTVDWDLTVDGGRRLQTGLYLYRVSIAADGSSFASRAKKLIVITSK